MVDENRIADLVGVAEAAEVLGISKQALVNWRARYAGFPAPVAKLRMGPLYSLKAVRMWAVRHGLAIKAPRG